jgi:hypothetical protein
VLDPGDRAAHALHTGSVAAAPVHSAQGSGLVARRLGPYEPVDGVAFGVSDREDPRDDEAEHDERRHGGGEERDATGP